MRCYAYSFFSCLSPDSPVFVTFPSLGSLCKLAFPPLAAAYLCFLFTSCLPLSVYCTPFPRQPALKKLANRSTWSLLFPVTTRSAVLGLQLVSVGDSVLAWCDPDPRRSASSSVSVTSASHSMLLPWRAFSSKVCDRGAATNRLLCLSLFIPSLYFLTPYLFILAYSSLSLSSSPPPPPWY